MPKVKMPEKIPVQRLPVYSRADFDLYHWAGKLLIPKGQMITPNVVAALVEAEIDFLHTHSCRRARPEDLRAIDIYSIQDAAPLTFAVFDRDGIFWRGRASGSRRSRLKACTAAARRRSTTTSRDPPARRRASRPATSHACAPTWTT